MVAFKHLTILCGLAASVTAQAQYGASENSAAVLAALKAADDSTLASRDAATAYEPGDAASAYNLTFENYRLRSDWQYIQFVAQSSNGFFSNDGAQAIIDFITFKLAPDTVGADLVYTNKRETFIEGGFIDFINPGLIQLRLSVADASAAVKQKVRSNKLTSITGAFLLIEQNYADTQQYQQFGTFFN